MKALEFKHCFLCFLPHSGVSNLKTTTTNKLLSVESRCLGNTQTASEEEGISPYLTAERQTKRKTAVNQHKRHILSLKYVYATYATKTVQMQKNRGGERSGLWTFILIEY